MAASSRGERQLLDKPLGYLARRRQAVGALKLPQRLLSGRPLFPVRLDRIAQFSQGGLGG